MNYFWRAIILIRYSFSLWKGQAILFFSHVSVVLNMCWRLFLQARTLIKCNFSAFHKTTFPWCNSNPSLRPFCSFLFAAFLYYIHRHRSIRSPSLSLSGLSVHQLRQIAFTCFANKENQVKMRKLENKTQEDVGNPEQRQASLPFHQTAAECIIVIVHGLEKKGWDFWTQ